MKIDGTLQGRCYDTDTPTDKVAKESRMFTWMLTSN